jgi:two-component system chemotaxis response regulator CheY
MPSVLIVDDNQFIRVMIREVLTLNEYDVAGEAANGLEAVEKYIQLKPDLVILDIYMPVKDGFSALQEIRQYNPHAKVIICSVISQQKHFIKALKLGAKDFITKPFEIRRLLDSMEKSLGYESIQRKEATAMPNR